MATYIGLAVGLLFPVCVWATSCNDLKGQIEKNDCSFVQFQAADKELTVAYKAYQKQLSSEQLLKLKRSQTDWIKYRESSCAYETSGVEGGSLHPKLYYSCMEQLTRARIQWVRALSECSPITDDGCPNRN